MKKSLPEKLEGSHIHMVGIKGTGMTALVEIFFRRKAVITGSDVSDKFYTDAILEKFGIKALPFSEKNITDEIDFVVYSSAYSPETNADLKAAVAKKIPLFLYTEALGAISEKSYSCAISGVHGKTSTTGLTGSILKELDLGAQILAGSAISSFGNLCTITTNDFCGFGDFDNSKTSENAHSENAKNQAIANRAITDCAKNIFVAETCEYQKHFLSFAPQIIVITSVESDHQDFFPTYESMVEAFVEFAEKLPQGGKLIFCKDDKGAFEVVEILKKKRSDIVFIEYGQSAKNNYKIEFGKIEDGVQYFKIGQNNFALKVPGKHEALDACAAVALCSELLLQNGKTLCHYTEKIAKGLLNFSGGKRRSEIISKGKVGKNSVIIMDDYGHHPTAIKTTLEGFRSFYPKRKIIVDFMSHTYTRTAALLDEFALSFSGADEIILHKIYSSAREDSSKAKVNGKTLFEKTKENFENVFYFEEPISCVDFVMEELAKKTEEKFSDGYLFVTMGAGDNFVVANEIANRLEKEEKND